MSALRGGMLVRMLGTAEADGLGGKRGFLVGPPVALDGVMHGMVAWDRAPGEPWRAASPWPLVNLEWVDAEGRRL